MPDFNYEEQFGFASEDDDQVGAPPPSSIEGTPTPTELPPEAPGSFNYEEQFGFSDEEPEPTPVEAPSTDLEWSDYGRMIMSGGASVGAGMGWLLEKFNVPGGTTVKDVSSRAARSWMDDNLDAIGIEQDGLSQGAREALQTEYLGDSTWGDKWKRARLDAAGSLLGTAAGMGLGSVFTKGLQAAGIGTRAAATVGYGAGEAGVAAPSGGAATEDEVRQMDRETLEQSLEYQAAYESISADLSDQERFEAARDMVAKAAGGDAAVITALTTFILSAPFGNKLDDLVTGRIGAASGRIGAGLRGAGTEATQEFLQSGAEQIASNVAIAGQADPTRAWYEGALESAVGGAVAGGLMGGVMGVGVSPQADTAAPEVPQAERNAALAAIMAAQEEAQQRVAEGGGDMMDQALAGEEAAGTVATAAQEDLARQEAELVAQEEAKAEAFEQAEQEVAAQKEAEVKELEYQAEVQRGEGVAAIEEATEAGQIEAKPAAVTLGEVSPALQQLKAERAKPKPIEGKPAPEIPLIEDKRAIVVGPDGTAMTGKQVDAQIKEQLAAQEVPADVNTTEEGQVEPIPVTVSGLDIRIENPKGTKRNGRTVKDHYGEIPAAEGADGDAIDVFLGSEAPTSDKVFIVDQLKEDGTFDEHKVMMGYPNEMAARRAYRRNYDKGFKVGPVTEMTVDQLKTWVAEGGTKAGPVGQEEVGAVISGQDELIAMQAREEFKGRRRPDVRYRIGDAQVDIIEDAPLNPNDPSDSAGPRAIHIQVTEGGRESGVMTLQERNAGFQVYNVFLSPQLRGKQYGQRMILEAARYAERQGKPLISDTSVSVAQLRAYEGLRKRGELVVEYSDPAEVQRALKEEDPSWSVVDARPVISRMFTPDFTRDIRYRDALSTPAGEAITAETVETDLAPLLDELSGLDIEILATPQDAPPETFEQIKADRMLGAKGLYDAETGQLFVFTENHRTMDDVVETILHEGVGHAGLRLMLGDRLTGVLDDIWQSGNQNAIRKIAEQYGLDVNVPAERATAVEEYVAHLAERSPQATVLEQIKGMIRQFLRELGLLENWTEEDINSLLRSARVHARGKPLNKIEIVEQAEIEETGEIVEIVEKADYLVREMTRRRNIAEKLRACVNG